MPLSARPESTLTDRYQTTVPRRVREVLKLGKRDRIRYDIQSNGSVCIARVEDARESDPVLEHFLDFLAHDMESHPERIRGIDSSLVSRGRSLVEGIEVDLGAPLSEEEE
ncbi:MAG TPA: type II toxin-antitoxin system PrlF family antitoxin [Desulfomicrobiaceae bacterium]|nr:type II toxin-antitoxin system PrlF family antitoxin [Desulfomicrobiaceae bacterium]